MNREEEEDEPIEFREEKGDISLQLGDIIKIYAPTHTEINEETFYIEYISLSQINLINVAQLEKHVLLIDPETHQFNDESITSLHILYRNPQKGYARQNGLLPSTWISIHFGGDFPAILNGEITNLEEDMIEITTFPELRVLYINFEYQGLPPELGITDIQIKEKPLSLQNKNLQEEAGEQEEEDLSKPATTKEEEDASMEFTDTGDSIITIAENARPIEDIQEILENLYVASNQGIIYGKKLEKIVHLVEIPEHEQRYSIERQVADMTDDFLSTIPTHHRTYSVLENIHRLIERYKELRGEFSRFDANHNAIGYKKIGEYEKPIVASYQQEDTPPSLPWIVPVVSNVRKLYDLKEEEEREPDTLLSKTKENLLTIENTQTTYYDKKNRMTNTDYLRSQRILHDTMNPFVPPPATAGPFLYAGKVARPIDAIVENADDFISYYNKNGNKIPHKYGVQHYTTGETYQVQETTRSGKRVLSQKELVPNDSIHIRSLLLLPEPVVRFSKVSLPRTSILERATLHSHAFLLSRLFHRSLHVQTHRIENEDKEIEYNETDNKFLTGIREYIVDKAIMNRGIEEEKGDTLSLLLHLLLPNNKTLIHLYRDHLREPFSFHSVITELEPFGITSSNITYKQFQEIRFHCKKSIEEYKVRYTKETNEYLDYNQKQEKKRENQKKNAPPSRLLRIFKDAHTSPISTIDTTPPQYLLSLQEKYGFSPASSSSHEIVALLLKTDFGNLFISVVSSFLTPLFSPTALFPQLTNKDQKIDDMGENEKIVPTDCSRRFLTKRYSSIRELQNDNNKTIIYYDKDLDDTPYSIMDKYKADKKRLSPELFRDFLRENLLENHDCPKEVVEEMTETLLAGKKQVREGEYALLEIAPTYETMEGEKKNKVIDLMKTKTYYRRIKDIWITDDTINDEAFIDNNTLFCNISSECYKNTKTATCSTIDENEKQRLHNGTRNSILKEFDTRIEMTTEEWGAKMKDALEGHLNELIRRKELNQYENRKYNLRAYRLGEEVQHYDVIVSPYLKIRELIMTQTDFTKKQADICRFVDRFTRKPMVVELEESPFWFYCLQTNVRLFPLSYFLLAKAFNEGGSPLYSRVLSQQCRTVGVMSDDGDSIVDRYTGFVLRKIDYSVEEGFDENGGRIMTREIMEEEATAEEFVQRLLTTPATTAPLKPALKNAPKKKVLEDEASEFIYRIMTAIAGNMDIPTHDDIDAFVLRITHLWNIKTIDTEKAYQRKQETADKKSGKPAPLKSYKQYRNERIIFNTASVLWIAIQTSIPSFEPKKSFSNCFRSLEGFPLGGIEDTSGLQYVSCVLLQMRGSVEPWDAVGKYKTESLTMTLRKNIEKIMTEHPDIETMIHKKKEYLLEHPENHREKRAREVSVSRWIHFLPPLVPFTIVSKKHAPSADFENEWWNTLKKGSKDQFKMTHILEGKITQFSFSVIEYIQQVVAKENLLLKTSSNIPFLENNCCNENEHQHPLRYFTGIQKEIPPTVAMVVKMAYMMERVKSLSKASLFYDPRITSLQYPVLPEGYLEKIAYSAVIYYALLDSPVPRPIPEEMHVFIKEKPAEYNRFWSLPEKIEFLKKHGKQYHLEDLMTLMRMVNTRNTVSIYTHPTFTPVDTFRDIVQSLEESDSSLIEAPLRELLRGVINEYVPYQYIEYNDEPTETGERKPLIELQKYLYTANNRMYNRIMAFYDGLSNVSPKEYNEVNDALFSLTDFKVEGELLHAVPQQIRRMITSMCRIYPTLLLNGGDFFTTLPQHWNFAPRHYGDIQTFIHKYYSKLRVYKEDTVLHRVFQEIVVRMGDLLLFVENIPIWNEMEKVVENEKHRFYTFMDRTTLFQLFSYCMFVVLDEYIGMAEDPEIIQVEIKKNKEERRAEIEEENDPSLFLGENEIDIIPQDRTVLKERIGSLLMTFLDIEEENKEAVNITYAEIMKKVGRNKQREKNRIIDTLGKMTIEERKYENVLKNLRLEHWNVGQSKGIYMYDKDTYNREKSLLDDMELVDAMANPEDTNTEEENPEEDDEEEENPEKEDENAQDIRGLKASYYDGEYYEEDGEGDDGLYDGDD